MSSTSLTLLVMLASKEGKHVVKDIALQAAYAEHIRPDVEFPSTYQQRITNIPVRSTSLFIFSGLDKLCVEMSDSVHKGN